MIKNVIIPSHIYKGIVHNDIAFPTRLSLFGFDTETVQGQPYTFQVSRDGKTADLIFVNAENILDKFLEYIKPYVLSGHKNVLYAHNLAFDLAVLLKKQQNLFIGHDSLKITYKGVKLDFIIAKLYFGRITFPGNKVLTVVDSYAFFTGSGKASLSALAEQLDLPCKKLGRMDDIGEKRYKKGTKKYDLFVEYTKQDAIVEWHLGKWIVEQYRKYNTRICVSAPQFSMRVFRHFFLKAGDVIAFPPPQAIRGCILSYHGGKNGYYLKGVNVVKKCYELDVVSMYPYALKSMPNFLSGHYQHYFEFTPEYEGVWCISGEVKKCRYPSIFSHDFKPLSGFIENIWVTSYELKTAMEYKEIVLSKCDGFVWIPDVTNFRNPFAEFVDYFFKLKDTAKNPAEKLLAKIILNSLYGKMIQTIEADEDNGESKKAESKKTVKAKAKAKEKKAEFKADFVFNSSTGHFIENPAKSVYTAGGMFNPFIATLITGFARAYLHRLEHTYKAIHSSTDSVKTTVPCKENKALGGIKIECRGKCILFRNKLYLHYSDTGWTDNYGFHKAGSLKKYALHGFIGRAKQLYKLFKSKRNIYYTSHMFKVREAFRQGKTPLKMERVKRELKDVDFTKIKYID